MNQDETIEFDLNDYAFSHQFKAEWVAKGFGNGCTISYRLEGDATSFVTLSDGTTVTIAPTPLTYYAQNIFSIVAYYSASTFESPPPMTPNLSKQVNIIVERDRRIDKWDI